MVVHKLWSELDIQDSRVLNLLIADDAEARHVDGSSKLNLALAPLSEGCPHINVCGMRDDISN